MRPALLTAALSLWLAGPAAAQVFLPIPVTGYNRDVIADAGGTAAATTTGPFDLTEYVLYQQGFNPAAPTRGVPANGTIVTSPTRAYQLGPIAGDNSLRVPPQTVHTLTLATPARYEALSLLLAAAVGLQPSAGGDSRTVSVNW